MPWNGCRSWTASGPGRHLLTHYRFFANVQVNIGADTKLVIATARPVPGNTADAKAWSDSGLASPTANAPAAHSCQARNRTTQNTYACRPAWNTHSPA